MKPYQVEMYKKSCPPGTRVELISMEDAYAVPAGTKGVVDLVDDIGTIHVTWENGRKLGICPDVDRFRRLDGPALDKEAGSKPSVSEQLKTAAKTAAETAPKENPTRKGDAR